MKLFIVNTEVVCALAVRLAQVSVRATKVAKSVIHFPVIFSPSTVVREFQS
jgi:hypothetical protein